MLILYIINVICDMMNQPALFLFSRLVDLVGNKHLGTGVGGSGDSSSASRSESDSSSRSGSHRTIDVSTESSSVIFEQMKRFFERIRSSFIHPFCNSFVGDRFVGFYDKEEMIFYHVDSDLNLSGFRFDIGNVGNDVLSLVFNRIDMSPPFSIHNYQDVHGFLWDRFRGSYDDSGSLEVYLTEAFGMRIFARTDSSSSSRSSITDSDQSVGNQVTFAPTPRRGRGRGRGSTGNRGRGRGS
jgi:hypothetical protein